ncbi:MAG: hypothetical protein ABI056_04080 [Caulobacteraceae bacterium]
MVSANDRGRRRRNVLGAILAGGFTAATLDFFAAMLIYHGTASGVAKAVARGWFGEGAKAGGTNIEVVGMASHWGILLTAASIFVLTSLRFPVLRHRAWITGPLFGICIYGVMHYVIVPLSAVHRVINPKGFQFMDEFAGHMLVIGLPIALWSRAILGED